jgi:hypothetical protein
VRRVHGLQLIKMSRNNRQQPLHTSLCKYKRGCQNHEGPNFLVCELNRFTSIKVQIFLWVSFTDLFNGGAKIFLWVSLTDLFNGGPDFLVGELNKFIQWRSRFSYG